MSKKTTGPSTISASFVSGAIAGVKPNKLSQSVDALLSGCNINPDVLKQKKGRILSESFSLLIKTLWRELQDEYLGLGDSVSNPGSFALMCQLAIGASTLRQALHRCIRFQKVLGVTPNLTLEETQQSAVITVVGNSDSDKENAFLYESLLVIYHRFSSWLIGHAITTKAIAFKYPPPEHYDEYTTLFPCRCDFEQSATSMTIDKQFLDYEVKKSNRELAKFLMIAPEGVLARPINDNSFSARIRKMIIGSEHLNLPGSPPTLEEVASSFAVTTQTLRRRLKQEGTTYKELKEDVRRDLAIYLLTENNAAIKDVSERLGFAETSAFQRAFKFWTGSTPAEYRSMHR